jgi:cytochrome b involved in lipid metabolism
LDITEIAKHNKSSDCWYLISGKVYNITSFFGSHPGGDRAMAPSCGKDATAAYKTKDPYATSSSGRSAHSSNAVSMLANYYIGDLNQTIGQQKITNTNIVTAPITSRNVGEWDD